MQPRLLSISLATAVLAAAAVSQTAIWSPNGYAAAAGNGNNAYPWNLTTTSIHYLQTYGAQNFILQGASFPLVITRLRFRTSSGSSTSGGSWTNVVLNMSTAALPYGSISTTYASNHGANLTTVYSGPVTVMPVSGATPGNVYIDITLSPPFLYTPGTGDLCFEAQVSGSGWSGSSAQCDAVQTNLGGAPAMCRRVYNLGSTSATVGSTDGFDYGLVTEFTYLPASGYAYAQSFGNGCGGLLLATSARPVLGTSINLLTSGIPPGTQLGADILSSTQYNPGIDLGVIGMPGCHQYLGLDFTAIFVVSGSSASVPLNVPNNPGLAGVRVQCQSATFTSGINPLGVIASNGVTLVLDLQ